MVDISIERARSIQKRFEKKLSERTQDIKVVCCLSDDPRCPLSDCKHKTPHEEIT